MSLRGAIATKQSHLTATELYSSCKILDSYEIASG